MKHLLTATVAVSAIVSGVIACRTGSNAATHSERLPLPADASEISRPETTECRIPPLPDRVDFDREVFPVLQQYCGDCHTDPVSPCRLNFAAAPSDWNADCRRLFQQITGQQPDPFLSPLSATASPSYHQLSDEPLQVLRRWIDEGAYVPDSPPRTAADWAPEERSHWAFQPLTRPVLPRAMESLSGDNPIDAFLAAKFQEFQVVPAPPADFLTLLRRLTFAVTGLPPGVEQLADEKNQSTGYSDTSAAWSARVQELLDSPEYGEHHARFWLDLVRYADTNGYEDDGRKPFAWKYRDFVIRALNRDLPYDQFVQFQVAGDLLAAESHPSTNNLDAFVACGFLRLAAWDSEPNDRLRAHYDQIHEIVSTTSLAFLGLSVGCARCHDHPLEPISCHDYAGMTAIFYSLARPTHGRLEQPLPAATPAELSSARSTRRQLASLQLRALQTDSETEAAALRQQARVLESKVQFEATYRFAETEAAGLPTRRLERGNPRRPAEFVAAGIPSILRHSEQDSLTTGSELPRLKFARWLTTDGHPVIARVIVNRVWQWHFGRGLCSTTSNLGLSGETPTHPELLDWLAHWFVHDARWSLKRLHHLILTSDAFRRQAEPATAELSHRQSLFGAFVSRPLRAEMLHDAMLEVAGLRSPQMFGVPTEQDNVSSPSNDHTNAADSATDRKLFRRAIYRQVRRNQPDPLLQAFGFPETSVSCEQRKTLHSVPRALALWNSHFAVTCANALAKRIVHQTTSDCCVDSVLQIVFQRVLGRWPDRSEVAAIHDFLQTTSNRECSVTETDLSCLCLVLFNLDEFVILK